MTISPELKMEYAIYFFASLRMLESISKKPMHKRKSKIVNALSQWSVANQIAMAEIAYIPNMECLRTVFIILPHKVYLPGRR
jgi:hypothetical protein